MVGNIGKFRTGRLAAAGLALALFMALEGAWPAAAATTGWTDRKEYDLVLKIRIESSPEKQLELLRQWEQQYPKSEMRQARRELFLAAYQAQGDTAHMFESAKEMFADRPDDLVGVYWCALLTPQIKDPKPEALSLGRMAANQLLSKLDIYFAPDSKPKDIPDADWQKRKDEAGLLANRAIGYVQWKTGDNRGAVKTLTAYLQKDPKSAEATAWLGLALAADFQPIPAAWQLARAASIHEEGALPEVWRRQMDEMATRLYVSYHGVNDEGLEKLRQGAAADPFPPPDFKVESKEVLEQRKADEALNRLDPMLAAWLRIQRRLVGPDGEKYFAEELKPNPLPKLRGTVIRCTPEKKPTEVVLALSGGTAEEVTLKVSQPFERAAAAGTSIEFQGMADSFTKEPLQLTVVATPDQISGWPTGK